MNNCQGLSLEDAGGSSSTITLKLLHTCSLEQQLQIRAIRNQPSVRSFMYSDHEIGLNEHLAWIKKVKADNKQIIFIVLNGLHESIGLVSINGLDINNKKADWAYYLNQNSRGGLGAALEYQILEYVFNKTMLEKLNCEVIETNQAVIKLHKKFNFIEEGFRNENIIKNGKRVGVFFLGLTKSAWKENRVLIFNKHRTVFEKYQIQFDIRVNEEEDPLTQIENARAKNNINWMALLRLSVEHNPNIAKPIISEILRLDREISNLTEKLVK